MVRERKIQLLCFLGSIIFLGFTLYMIRAAVPLVTWLRDERGILDHLTLGTCGIFLSVLAGVWALRPGRSVKSGMRVAGVLLSYLFLFWAVPESPERFHLVHFSLFALVLRAFLPGSWNGFFRSFLTFGLITLVGIVDEFLQRWVPGRQGSVHDVLLSSIAALLILIYLHALPARTRS